MGLFGRKKGGGESAAPKGKQPKFISKDQSGGSTYEVYKGRDAESAKAFLMTKRVDKPQYYVVVETPEGNWGMDVKGLYLERLLSWQTNIGSAKCEGHICGLPDQFSLQAAARGINDNLIATVHCGKCEHEWPDGVRYQNITVVRCPKCRTLNKVDSSGHTVLFT